MTESKHEVTVEIVADAKKFRDELKQTADDVKEMDKLSADLKKQGIVSDREQKRVSKDLRKANSVQGAEALKLEKSLKQAMVDRRNEWKKQLKTTKDQEKTNKDFIKDQTALNKEYLKTKQLRKDLVGLTRTERGMRGMKRVGGGLGRMGLRAAGWGLAAGAAAIGGRIGSVASLGEGISMNEINMAGTNVARGDLRKAYRQSGKLGYSPEESLQQAIALRGTGMQGKDLTDALATSQQLARAGMMDQGQVAGMMVQQAQGGLTGKRGQKDLEKTLTNAFSSGLDRGRVGEFFKASAGLVQQAQQFTAGNVGFGGVSAKLAMLGQGGAAGLQGARGAQVAQRLDQAIRQPGGGEQGQALVLRALGFGQPGGGASYTEAYRRQQRGFLGKGGAKNLQDVFGQLEAETGGGEEFSYAASQLTGLTMDQVDEVKKSLDAMKDKGATDEEIQKELKNLTKDMKPLQDQANEVIKTTLAEEAVRQSRIQNQMLGEYDSIKDSLHKLQDVANEVYAQIWPQVTALLQIIADTVQAIWEGIKTILPENVEEENRKREAAAAAKTSKTDKTMTAYLQGDITREEADLQLRKHAKEAADELLKKGGTIREDQDKEKNTTAELIQLKHNWDRANQKRELLKTMKPQLTSEGEYNPYESNEQEHLAQKASKELAAQQKREQAEQAAADAAKLQKEKESEAKKMEMYISGLSPEAAAEFARAHGIALENVSSDPQMPQAGTATPTNVNWSGSQGGS